MLYSEADELLGGLGQASPADKRKLLKPVIDADLLVLDDLFLARQLPAEAADVLQSILHKRYKLRRSSLITSNRIIDDWHKYLGDAALATAILDRSCIAACWRSSAARAIASKRPPAALPKLPNPSNNPHPPVCAPGGI